MKLYNANFKLKNFLLYQNIIRLLKKLNDIKYFLDFII